MTPSEAYGKLIRANSDTDVLDWEEIEQCEAVVAESAFHSFRYAYYVIKRPFHKGEMIISQYGGWAARYAIGVLKGPFPLGEQSMFNEGDQMFTQHKDDTIWQTYSELLMANSLQCYMEACLRLNIPVAI